MRISRSPGVHAWIIAVILGCIAVQGRAESPPADPPGITREFVFDHAPFRSCHASTICQTPSGLLVAFFGGTSEGSADVGIWVARHDGKQWLDPTEVARGLSDTGKAVPCWNPVLFQSPGGPTLLFYKVGKSPKTWWGMLITSADDGKTWGEPARLPEGILGPTKDKPILVGQTLLCPSSSEDNGWRAHVEWTSNLGKTWASTGPLNDGATIGAIQPTLLLHDAEHLQMLCRTKQKKIAEAWSKDGGKTWGEMTLTDLPNPNSGIDAVQLRDGRSLLVYNHTERGRSPLNMAISEDGGKTWPKGPVLETEAGEYSYPAVIQTADGMVHIVYTWRRERIRHVVVDLAKVK